MQEGTFFALQLFAWLSIKKLEIEKTMSTFIISVLKVELGGRSFFDFQLFINKIHQASNWSKF